MEQLPGLPWLVLARASEIACRRAIGMLWVCCRRGLSVGMAREPADHFVIENAVVTGRCWLIPLSLIRAIRW